MATVSLSLHLPRACVILTLRNPNRTKSSLWIPPSSDLAESTERLNSPCQTKRPRCEFCAFVDSHSSFWQCSRELT